MKKLLLASVVAGLLAPVAAMAQDEKTDLRLANLEMIVVTAPKTQPRDYKPDAKTQALLADIAKAAEEPAKK